VLGKGHPGVVAPALHCVESDDYYALLLGVGPAVDRVVDREPRARSALSAFGGRRAAIGAGSVPRAESRAPRNA